MSEAASPPPSSPSRTVELSPNVLAAAALRRAQEGPQVASEAQRLKEYEIRQSFRRLVDPGILRPNSQPVATAALKTLLTISENLLREPENPKFQQFKATNDTIRKRLIDPKGALEYAIALGFRPEVEYFQPLYRWNPKRMTELRIGATILREAFDLQVEKEERLERNKKDQKAAASAAVNNVKQAFMDDRKTKELKDKRERDRREARAAAMARGELDPTPVTPKPRAPSAMPGTVQSTSGSTWRSATAADTPAAHGANDHESGGDASD